MNGYFRGVGKKSREDSRAVTAKEGPDSEKDNSEGQLLTLFLLLIAKQYN